MNLDGINWEFVTVIGIALTFIMGRAYKIFYDFIIKNSNEFRTKKEQELDKKINDFKKNKEPIQELSLFFLKITKLENLIEKGKKSFEIMFLFGAAVLISSIFYMFFPNFVLTSEEKPGVSVFLLALIISAVLFLLMFKTLYDSKQKLDKYLKGVPVKELIGEDE